MQARTPFYSTDFFKNLANIANNKFDDALTATYIDFANFHMLDDNSDHDLNTVKSVFRSYGSITSLFYFDYDDLSDEQMDIAFEYSWSAGQIKDDVALPLHDFMLKLHDFV